MIKIKNMRIGKKYFFALLIILLVIWDAVPKNYCNNDFLCGVLKEINEAKLGSIYEHDMKKISQKYFDTVGWKKFIHNAQSHVSKIVLYDSSNAILNNENLTLRIESTLMIYTVFGIAVSRKYVEFDLRIHKKDVVLVRATGHILGP